MSDELWVIRQRVDLSEGVRGNDGAFSELMVPGDHEGHEWRIEVFEGGSRVKLSGCTAAAYFMAAGASAAVMVTGAINENVISFRLQQACYAAPGRMRAVARLAYASGNRVVTLADRVFRVRPELPGDIIDPGDAVPGIDVLLAEIDRMEAATDAAEAVVNQAAPDIAALKAADKVWQGLANEGVYEISAGDMESGQWSYSAKADNLARLRYAQLIPVKKGMTVVYTNAAQDVYFGVLETPTSTSYYPGLSGWKGPAVGGVFRITQDGWMTFIVRDHADITKALSPEDYDCEIQLKTADHEAAAVADAAEAAVIDELSIGTAVAVRFASAAAVITGFPVVAGERYYVHTGAAYSGYLVLSASTDSETVACLYSGKAAVLAPVADGYLRVYKGQSDLANGATVALLVMTEAEYSERFLNVRGESRMVTTAAQLSGLTGGTMSAGDFPAGSIVCIGAVGLGLVDYPRELTGTGTGTYMTVAGKAVLDDNRNGVTQLYIGTEGSATRWKVVGAWSAWIVHDGFYISPYGQTITTAEQLSALTGNTDSANAFPVNAIVTVGAALKVNDAPSLNGGVGVYLTLKGIRDAAADANGVAQLFISTAGTATRWKASGAWSAWIAHEGYYVKPWSAMIIDDAGLAAVTGGTGSVNALPVNSVVCIGTVLEVDDGPELHRNMGVYLTLKGTRNTAADANGVAQIFISSEGLATRWKVSGSWSAWVTTARADGPKEYHVGPTRSDTRLISLLLDLAEDETNEKVIYIDGGEYDLFEEYLYEVGQGRLEIPLDSVTSPDYLGNKNAFVPNNTRIVGVGDVVLKFMPTVAQLEDMSTDANRTGYGASRTWSPLNIYGSVEIENITVKGKNCRYCLHNDDKSRYEGEVQVYRNVRFLYYASDVNSQGRQLGFNMPIGFCLSAGSTHSYEGCEMYYEGDGNHAAFYGHAPTPNASNGTLILRDCVIHTTNFSNNQTISLQTLSSGLDDRVRTRFENCYINGGLLLNMNQAGSKQAFEVTLVNCNRVPVVRWNAAGGTIVDPHTVTWYNPLARPTASAPLIETDSYGS